MKVLVNEMPKKKEECLFYRKYYTESRVINTDCCGLSGKSCSFKNGESIFGGECRFLKVGSTNI